MWRHVYSYVYTNTTRLVLHSSYLVRLHCFSNAFNWWVIALNDYFGWNTGMYKNALFLLKNCKNRPALGDSFAPISPCFLQLRPRTSGGWGLCPPHWKTLATPMTLPTWQKHANRLCFMLSSNRAYLLLFLGRQPCFKE